MPHCHCVEIVMAGGLSHNCTGPQCRVAVCRIKIRSMADFYALYCAVVFQNALGRIKNAPTYNFHA